MRGRIRDADLAEVRARSPIADVVGQYLALRPAGGGELKGLCPFHEEKTPSFQIAPERGVYYCFGCGAGGDVIDFVKRIEHLDFNDAVESLAQRAGVELQYEQGGAAPARQAGERRRLLDAHTAAAEFYAEQLATPEAEIGRRFLSERGFDQDAARRFGVGYAPASWDTLLRHLHGRGFSAEELLTGGLLAQGRRGPVDRFRGRLVWPIRDVKGDTIGFGARRLREDDPQSKYVNTPDTPIYKKSQVLYGLDLAKDEIARRHQAVVVEGYTDVMACHLAGVLTAVATCGTAFGPDHVSILRRRLMDQDEFRGRVIYTFDGDEAGRRAAIRAFNEDQRFVAQTFVAVEPNGLDPCELRLAHGDAAVRDLVADHVPLFEFVLRTVVDRYDVNLPEGRVAALDAAAPVVTGIKDWALRAEYGRRLAGLLGMDVETVLARVRGDEPQRPGRPPAPSAAAAAPPPRDDPRFAIEREALKLAIQRPALVGPQFDALDPDVFTSPAYAAVFAAVLAAGGAGTAPDGPEWVARIRSATGDQNVDTLVLKLAADRLATLEHDLPRYASSVLARLQEMAVTRLIEQKSSRLQRLNAVDEQDEVNRLFGEIIALEQYKRGLREQAMGAL